MLLVLSLAELLGMALWFSASAVSAPLAARWALSPSQTGWLTAIVQLGFVVGTATSAVLNLADVVPAPAFALSAAAALGECIAARVSGRRSARIALFRGLRVGGGLSASHEDDRNLV